MGGSEISNPNGKSQIFHKKVKFTIMSKVFTVVGDAGHGGDDSGAVYSWNGKLHKESEYVLDINNRVAGLCAKNPYINYISTRTTDVFLSFDKRAEAANSNNADLFISYHLNASGVGGHGFEGFTTRGKTESDAFATVWYNENKKLFPDLQVRSDWSDNDPDKEASFAVLRKTSCPALLTEHGFIDNVKDLKIIITPEGRQKMALSIYNSIVRHFNLPEEESVNVVTQPNEGCDHSNLIKRFESLEWQLKEIKKELNIA